MSHVTITVIIISFFGSLIVSMSGIIKMMVSDKLKDLKEGLKMIQEAQNDLRENLHKIDLRLTRLEVEHDLEDK